MKVFEYTLQLTSPVVLTTNSSDENTMQTKDFIPGYVMLGALSTQYQRLSNDNKQFFDFFLSGNVQFTNAFIAPNGRKTVPAPMAIHSDKVHTEEIFFVPRMSEVDKEKHPSTKPLNGYVTLEANTLTKHTVQKGFHFHINTKDRDENEDTGIFHYEFIKKGQTFKGIIKSKEDLSQELEAFLSQVKTLRLGRSKNTEYGTVTFSFKKIEEEIQSIPESKEITLYFESPVILRNRQGYFSIGEKALREELGLNQTYKIPEKFFRTETIENFRIIWSMKAPSIKAFKAGSTFTIRFCEDMKPETKERLQNILSHGLGYKCHEGFGEVSVLNLSQSQLTLKTLSTTSEKLEEPERPSFMKNVLKNITRQIIEQKVDNKVLEDAKQFSSKIPTNSLLSKIDLMVKDVNSLQTFQSMKMDKLRQHAKDQLNHCRSHSITLYQLLTEDKHSPFTFDEEKNYIPDIEEKANTDFRYRKRYISGMMRRLRKINKEKDLEKDGDKR